MKLALHHYNNAVYPPMSITYTKGLTIRLLKDTRVVRATPAQLIGQVSFRETIIPAGTLVIVWDLDIPSELTFINRPVYGPVVLWNDELWCNFLFHDLLEGIDWARL